MKSHTQILNILVGSKNPVKINAAAHVFTAFFPQHEIKCVGIHAPCYHKMFIISPFGDINNKKNFGSITE